MKKANQAAWIIAVMALLAFLPATSRAQSTGLLTPEESLWLKSRNNTIVVYPLDNDPPFSYKNSAGNPEGLAIDYLGLIAEKVGAKIQYLTPRPLVQVESDMQAGKGDVLDSIASDDIQGQYLIFTDDYLTSPAVIVARKDYQKKSGLTLSDFDGKRVAVVAGSALESYMRVNYPRVVVEEVTDDEIALQQVVLGEVDSAAMDVASLSYFLSKQVLSSVHIVGDTGFEYGPSFGVQKNLPILQSILEKGMSQISQSERQNLNDKWVSVPAGGEDSSLLADIGNNSGGLTLYILFGLGVIIVVILLLRRREAWAGYRSSPKKTMLEEEVSLLEKSNILLKEELKDIRKEEDLLEQKLDSLKKDSNGER
jgi:ABC-type amino acid transport substrate-binding protein